MESDDGGGNGDPFSAWPWECEEEYDLSADVYNGIYNDTSNCLWDEGNQTVNDYFPLIDEHTPVKECTNSSEQLYDIKEFTKELEDSKLPSQLKRRRMLQFAHDGTEMDCSLAVDELTESFQWHSDISGENCLVNSDGMDQFSDEGWVAHCSNDHKTHSTSSEMNNHVAFAGEDAVSEFMQILPDVKADTNPRNNNARSRTIVIKKGRKSVGGRAHAIGELTKSVAYPFALVKPSGIHGDVTLNDINERILAPPPFKIKHKVDSTSMAYPISAFSGKPVVCKTKILTEGGKGSITIMRTKV